MADLFKSWEVAALIGEDERAFGAKLSQNPILRELGRREGPTRVFDVGDAFLLVTTWRLQGGNRKLGEVIERAAGLANVAVLIWNQELGQPGCDVYAVEIENRAGEPERYVVETPDQLADLMRQAALSEAAGARVLNLSEIVSRVSLGWQIVRIGAPAARKNFEAALEAAGADEGARDAALEWYRGIEEALQRSWPKRQSSPFDPAYEPREKHVA